VVHVYWNGVDLRLDDIARYATTRLERSHLENPKFNEMLSGRSETDQKKRAQSTPIAAAEQETRQRRHHVQQLRERLSDKLPMATCRELGHRRDEDRLPLWFA